MEGLGFSDEGYACTWHRVSGLEFGVLFFCFGIGGSRTGRGEGINAIYRVAGVCVQAPRGECARTN